MNHPRPARVERRPAFVGRRSELAALTGALEQTAHGRPAVVVLEGVAGIGKTALLQRVCAETSGVRCLWVAGEEWERNVPFALADQLLRMDGQEGCDALVEGSNDHVAVGLEILKVLDRDHGEPLLVVVDDAHWVDAWSLRSLLFAARRLVDHRVLLVVATRAGTGLPDGLRRLAERTFRLAPLTVDELAELASALSVELLPREARRLTAHTGGNPLYARALLAEVPAETWTRDGPLPVPRSYGEVVRARLEGTSGDARRLVEGVAVVGVRSALATAASVGGVEEPTQAFDDAAAAELLVLGESAAEPVVTFPHPLARRAVEQTLSPSRRVQLHAAAAQAATDKGTALRHRVEAALGPDPVLAAEADTFARHELRRGAWSGAVAGFQAASRVSGSRIERERRLLDAVEAAMYAGDGATAHAVCAESSEWAAGPRRDSVLAYLALYDGDADAAGRHLQSAWRELDVAAERQLAATVAQRMAFLATSRHRGAEGVEWAQRALALASEDATDATLAGTQLAAGLGLLGRRAEGHAVLDGCLARIEGTIGANGFPVRAVKGAFLLGDDDLAAARPMLADGCG